jgi:hypothetical protein
MTNMSGTDASVSTDKSNYVLGELTANAKDLRIGMMKCDRIAMHQETIKFLSVFAEKGRVKQLRSFLAGAVKGVTLDFTGPKLFKKEDLGTTETWKGRHGQRLMPDRDGYFMRKKDLDFGMCHAHFIAKSPGFILKMSPIALFKQVKRSTIKNPITTPFIPEWLPYLEKQLRDQYLLEECFGHRCDCGVFTATSGALERIIREGLQDGAIAIPDPPTVNTETDKQLVYHANPKL